MTDQPPTSHHPLIRPLADCACACQQRAPEDSDDLRDLALLIRQGLKLIVVGIERKYGLKDKENKAA